MIKQKTIEKNFYKIEDLLKVIRLEDTDEY
jgi:hypothetical protein